MAKSKRADEIRQLYNMSNNLMRKRWQEVNQKGFEFANDEQLSAAEKNALEDQGMPTFIINRILPVVEMLNYYATANNPRWQAIGVEGSDIDVATVFGELAEYIWHLSDGSTLYSNTINDSITKSIGYMLITTDPNMDNGMGEVTIQQPDPFDIYIDPKSRDMLFRDAAFILIRKVLPKNHLIKIFPQFKKRITDASSDARFQASYSRRALNDDEQHLFLHDDNTNEQMGITPKGEQDEIVEFFECYEKKKVSYVNVFYRKPPTPEELANIKQQVQVQLKELQQELEVKLLEQQQQMEEAVKAGKMLPERYELEMEKAQKLMQSQLEGAEQQFMSELQAATSRIENQVMLESDLKKLKEDQKFTSMIVNEVQFYDSRIKLSCIAGDTLLYDKLLPDTVRDYPLIPFHYKWTGTPLPMSAVSPLIGKQREINKSHQIMVHNASLGSSLRWMYEEGSIDAELWEKYSSSPGALLPTRPGLERPTPVMPAPLSNAFFQIVQEGKSDMEYLAGIYSSMQGDTQQQHETFRGMLALDEYGTRRIKQWMTSSIEPALRQTGRVIQQFSQAVYSANKRFRIVQPSALQEDRQVEINIPLYNDLGEAIGKSMDYEAAKFDIRVVSGSTLPVNRWAYLEELKQLMELGVVDDIAVLAETDIRNKEKIAKRKSLYSQLNGQVSQLTETVSDREGTIETLERQLVQAGIKMKILQAGVEIDKAKGDAKGSIKQELLETQAEQKLLRRVLSNDAATKQKEMSLGVKEAVQNTKNNLQGNNES